MLHSVTAKQVAIVCFDQDLKNADLLSSLGHPAPRVVCYQVTIDPARLSPEGEFIRFGMGNDELGQGDEITGWIALADLTVEGSEHGYRRSIHWPYLGRNDTGQCRSNHQRLRRVLDGGRQLWRTSARCKRRIDDCIGRRHLHRGQWGRQCARSVPARRWQFRRRCDKHGSERARRQDG
jgi:hypothetical protein